MGNIKTAMVNWLFARKNRGEFVIRLDDTNRGRFDESSVAIIRDTLLWLGLDWDEGFDKPGSFGPYVQSERLDIYYEFLKQLLRDGWAYRCNCSSSRLEELRDKQKIEGRPVQYDGLCREKSPHAISDREPHVVRFRVPHSIDLGFDDLIWGKQNWLSDQLDDFILLRSNGFPTYHLAVVIDDYLMQMSHIIRADSLIPSTPKHILLYKTFGWECPVYAHFPLVLGKDGRKLSKRHGSVGVLDFRQLGYLSDVVFAYIALLGHDSELLDMGKFPTREQIIQAFSIENLGRTPYTFVHDKIDWLNGKYLRQLPLNEFIQHLEDYYSDNNLYLDKSKLSIIAPQLQPRITLLSDAPPFLNFLFIEDNLALEGDYFADFSETNEQLSLYLSSTVSSLSSIANWEFKNIDTAIRNLIKDLDTSPKNYFNLLRLSLTGQSLSLPIIDSIFALGKCETISRLKSRIEFLKVNS